MQNEKYLRNIMEYPGGAGDSTLPAETRMMMTTAMATGILDGTPQSPIIAFYVYRAPSTPPHTYATTTTLTTTATMASRWHPTAAHG